MSKKPAHTPAEVKPEAQTGAQPEAQPEAQTEAPPEAPPAVTEVSVSAVRGDIRHLFTNVVFNKYPQTVELDSFLQAQIDAGKLRIHLE